MHGFFLAVATGAAQNVHAGRPNLAPVIKASVPSNIPVQGSLWFLGPYQQLATEKEGTRGLSKSTILRGSSVEPFPEPFLYFYVTSLVISAD